MSNYVTIIQGLSQNDLAKAMEKSDIIVLPSLWETFGRVVYEGLSSGLPAVLKKGIDCFSTLYKQDFIFSYNEVNEATEIVLSITNNPKLYKK